MQGGVQQIEVLSRRGLITSGISFVSHLVRIISLGLKPSETKFHIVTCYAIKMEEGYTNQRGVIERGVALRKVFRDVP